MPNPSNFDSEFSKRSFDRATIIAFLLFLIGLGISILAFYPGWMSMDSSTQYFEAQHNHYSDWHPVLMAWWWHLLIKLKEGPALFLLQNVICYWLALLIFFLGAKKLIGRAAILFLVAGFIPGILFPLGQIWKDVVFAVLIVLCIAVTFHGQVSGRTGSWLKRAFILSALILAYGSKTNGITAIPFVIYYVIYVEFPKLGITKRLATVVCVLFGVVGIANILVPEKNITHSYGLQYTQSYDLLGISVETESNLLPEYINKRIAGLNKPLSSYYYVGSNNLLFYSTGAGNLTTTDLNDLEELRSNWLNAIKSHPLIYLKHRTKTFGSLLRIGEESPAWVAVPEIVDTSIPFTFKKNLISDFLESTQKSAPAMYFPWIYLALLLGSACFWRFIAPQLRPAFATMQASAWGFIAPHFFIVPASDYRYLYYAYFCAIFSTIIVAGSLLSRLKYRHVGNSKNHANDELRAS
jgi:hypothetical protein